MQITTDAIVVRRAEYKDYDRMLTLYSPTHGRIDAIARGCRRPTSAIMAASELFCAGAYTLNLSGGRYSVTQCQIKDSFYSLRFDVDRLMHGSYYLSLADAAALPDMAGEAIFYLLLKALAHLAYSDMPPQLLTAAFEMRYMPLMGYTPSMERCILCGAPVEGNGRFDARRGGVICHMCPSTAPKISNGARRIIWKAAQTDFTLVDKLVPHPDWPEAARLYRPFVTERIERRSKILPDLP